MSIDGYGEADWRRLHADGDGDERSPFARDYDRLIYTPEFRRLQGKTQVVTAGEAGFFRTRLTHTVEVAQVARRLAESVNRRAQAAREAARTPQHIADWREVAELPGTQQKIDPDLVEAAATLHDLGHPPFAHVGEMTLSRAVDKAAAHWQLDDGDGFDGNAQSFRLAVKVLSHHGEGRGLQLTVATLDASLKYPWSRSDPGRLDSRKWSVGATEVDELADIRSEAPAALRRVCTLEAGVMDWADDVAYSVHDLEDWYRAGYMPLARLATDRAEQDRIASIIAARMRSDEEADDVRAGLAARIREEVLTAADGPFEEFRAQHRDGHPIFDATSGAARRAVRRLRGNVFDDATSRWTVTRRAEAPPGTLRRYAFAFELDEPVRFKVDVLKELLRCYVIADARLATQQSGHTAVMRRLFRVHERAARKGDLRLFPADRRSQLESGMPPLGRLRSVVDHIASLTDVEALRLHERLRTGGGRLHDYA